MEHQVRGQVHARHAHRNVVARTKRKSPGPRGHVKQRATGPLDVPRVPQERLPIVPLGPAETRRVVLGAAAARAEALDPPQPEGLSLRDGLPPKRGVTAGRADPAPAERRNPSVTERGSAHRLEVDDQARTAPPRRDARRRVGRTDHHGPRERVVTSTRIRCRIRPRNGATSPVVELGKSAAVKTMAPSEHHVSPTTNYGGRARPAHPSRNRG
jgi:hypothetical protein